MGGGCGWRLGGSLMVLPRPPDQRAAVAPALPQAAAAGLRLPEEHRGRGLSVCGVRVRCGVGGTWGGTPICRGGRCVRLRLLRVSLPSSFPRQAHLPRVLQVRPLCPVLHQQQQRRRLLLLHLPSLLVGVQRPQQAQTGTTPTHLRQTDGWTGTPLPPGSFPQHLGGGPPPQQPLPPPPSHRVPSRRCGRFGSSRMRRSTATCT